MRVIEHILLYTANPLSETKEKIVAPIDIVFLLCYNCAHQEVIPITIVDRIKKVRKEKRLSQTEFAEALGITRAAVANLETGRATPRSKLIKNICRVFEINEVWLQTGDGDMYAGLTQREELAVLMGRFLAQNPESAKRIIIQALLECNDAVFFEKCVNLAQSIVQASESIQKEEEGE